MDLEGADLEFDLAQESEYELLEEDQMLAQASTLVQTDAQAQIQEMVNCVGERFSFRTMQDTYVSGNSKDKPIKGTTANGRDQEWRCEQTRDGVYRFKNHRYNTYLFGTSKNDVIAKNGYKDGGEWSVSFNPDGRACIKNIRRNRYLESSSDGKDF